MSGAAEAAAPRTERVRAEHVLAATGHVFDVFVANLVGRSRRRFIAHPRMIAMWVIRDLTGASLADVGRALGGRHHTTVLAGQRKVQGWLESDSALADDVADAIARIRAIACGLAAEGR